MLSRIFVASLTTVVLLAGCVSYAPNELASMAGADLCEVLSRQGRNLSQDTRQAIQSELQRRNDNCSNHAAEVAQRFDDFMYRETYGNQSP